jgi:hypothetical protein
MPTSTLISANNQKGFAHFLLLFIIIAGIAVGVYLTQFTQVFKPKAADLKSTSEEKFNYFGDFWSRKKPPEPGMVQAALTTGCHRAVPDAPSSPTAEEISFFSKSNTGFVFEECAIFMEDDATRQYYQNLTNSLKSSGVKYVGYSVLLQADANQTGVSAFYDSGAKQPVPGYEDFFLYGKDGGIHKQGPHPILNITSGRFRSYIISKMVDYMNRTGLGGVLIDTGYSENSLRERKIVDVDEVASNTGAPIKNWNANYIDFLRDLNAAMDQAGQNRLLFVNAEGRDSAFVEALLPSVDGIMLEDPIGPVGIDFASRAASIAPVLDRAAALDKYILVVVNTNINCTDPGAINCFNEYLPGAKLGQLQVPFSEYYLAAYLNLIRNQKTVLVYYSPTPLGPQFISSAFFRNWDLKIGSPVGAMSEVSPGVFLRKFENAFVYFNNSGSSFQPQGVDNLFAADGKEITSVIIPAKSGKVFVTKAILDEWNTLSSQSRSSFLTINSDAVKLKTPAVSCVNNRPTVQLDWTAPGNLIYKIFMRGIQYTDDEIQIGITSSPSFNVESGLTPGHSYEFLVEAQTPSGPVYANNSWSGKIFGWTKMPSCAAQ